MPRSLFIRRRRRQAFLRPYGRKAFLVFWLLQGCAPKINCAQICAQTGGQAILVQGTICYCEAQGPIGDFGSTQ